MDTTRLVDLDGDKRVPDRQAFFELARNTFGIHYLFPYQQLVISRILEFHQGETTEGRQLVILPTGAGKSLCFMLPGLLLPGVTLVIYPLLSLINDQCKRLGQAGIPVEVLRGGQSSQERYRIFTRLHQEPHIFLLTNPEMLCVQSVLKHILSLPLAHIVIDEAHTVIEWGSTFRPSYLQLGPIIHRFNCKLITAFTATASQETIDTIKEQLFRGNRVHLVHGGADRPNIFYQAIPSLAKNHDLYTLLKHKDLQRPVLIFCARRDTTETLARLFRIKLKTKEIFSYHAGMHTEQRKRVELWFHESDYGILFATKAFGMGVDKKNIRTVIHYDLPSTYSEYLQEAGRAGRDGAPSLAAILYTQTDLKQERSELISYLRDTTHCRRVTLLKDFTPLAPQSCFGCDVCSKQVIDRPDGEGEILECIRHNNRRLSIAETIQILAGRWSSETKIKHVYLRWGFGLLSTWDIADIRTAIYLLIADSLSPLCSAKRKQILFVKGAFVRKNSKKWVMFHMCRTTKPLSGS